MHFAAYAYVGESVIDPAKYYKNNLAETILLLEALLEDSKKRKYPDQLNLKMFFSSIIIQKNLL